jgi:[acyl-carrier-protein] S-malonyltransferase
VTARARSKHNGKSIGGLALLFPGQGSQRAGMGKHVVEISPAAREIFQQADETLDADISRLCSEGSDEELEVQENTQPALLTTSLAYLAYLRERLGEMGRRLRPSLVAGHSLGQYSAAVAAGSLDFTDALRLVRERGRIMAEWARQRPGGLAAVLGLSDRDLDDVCREAASEGAVGIALVNAPGQTVISGETNALARAMQLAKERGGRVTRLPISVPSHLPAMRDATRELSRFLSTIQLRDPSPPLVSTLSARLLTTAEEVREELSVQISQAIQWARCVLEIANQGATSFVDVGPGRALANMVRRITGDEPSVFAAEHMTNEDFLRMAETLPLADEAAQRIRAAR